MKNLLLLLGVLVCFAGCNKDDDESWEPEPEPEQVIPAAPKIGTIAFADITDAAALYITSSASEEGTETKASSEIVSNTLFKITKSGETVEVQFTSEEQENVDQPEVLYVRDLSEKYLYMSYNNVWKYDTVWYYDNEADTTIIEFKPQWEYTQVLVKKDDGAVFKIDNYGALINSKTDIQVDYNENVYFSYHDYGNKLMKIYTHGKEVYLTQINRDDMTVDENWLVDRQGNVWINDTYARLASGEFTHTPGGLESAYIAYGDSEGFYSYGTKIVFIPDDNPYWNGGYTVTKSVLRYMQAESPEMQWKEHKVLEKYTQPYADDPYFEAFAYKEKTIVFATKYNYGGGGFTGRRLIIKNRNDIQEEKLTDLDPMFYKEGFKYYGDRHPCTEKYLYKFTDREIWRLNIETCEVELLYDFSKEYIIKDIKVKNNFVTCNAFELRKGNDVVLEIYEDKTVHLVESINNDKIIYLERLN